MSKNPFKDSTKKTGRAVANSLLDLGVVKQADDNAQHTVLVEILSTDQRQGPVVASVMAAKHGDISVPEPGTLVVLGRVKGRRPIVLGTLYSTDDSVPSYVVTERVLADTIRVSETSTDSDEVTGIDQIFLAEDTPTNINQTAWSDVSWSSVTHNDDAYTFSDPVLTFQVAGTYEIVAETDFQSSGDTRQNPNLRILHNGAQVGVMGRSGYMRDSEGHNHASVHARAIVSASKGDTVHVEAIAEAETTGSIVPDNAQMYVKKLAR